MDAAQLRAQAAHYFEIARKDGPECDRNRLVAQDYIRRAEDIEEATRYLLQAKG